MRLLLFLLFACLAVPLDAAERPGILLKPNDVIALVGGEEMVVASELGYLESLLQSGLPDARLKFRSLAWEGDTVFTQQRDLNYPTLEAQLQKMGATVVIAQFGLMESLGGKEKLPEFVAAYEKLISRLSNNGQRRVLLVGPHEWPVLEALPKAERDRRNGAIEAINKTLEDVAKKTGTDVLASVPADFRKQASRTPSMHLTIQEQRVFADRLSANLADGTLGKERSFAPGLPPDAPLEKLRQLVVAKNRLWFNYTRPQNWAFLAGDRTIQPSSRDHLDPSKRWFPGELEQFVPLIDGKEKEIWELAAKLK